MAFSLKPMLKLNFCNASSKNRHFFAILWRKYFQNLNIGPWSNWPCS
jgi:hypothetical protein